MVFIKTMMNEDQIYSYLLKLKNCHIGPNNNYKNTFYGYKNKCFHFVYENLVSCRGTDKPLFGVFKQLNL